MMIKKYNKFKEVMDNEDGEIRIKDKLRMNLVE